MTFASTSALIALNTSVRVGEIDMTQRRIEAEIVGIELDPFAGLRDAVYVQVSTLVKEGSLSEAFALVAIDGKPHALVARGRRIVALTADVPIDETQKIVNRVGRIPGLKVTRTDFVDDIDSWPPELRD